MTTHQTTASPSAPDSRTTLYVNGRIYTPGSSDASAMAITGDTVVWVGQDRPARALHPDAEVIDLGGAFVAPAFVDPHVHVTATGLLEVGLDLTETRSAAGLLAAVRDYVHTHPDAPIVWGNGWDSTTWTHSRWPSTAEIDEACAGRPAYLCRIDEHSAFASTALREAVPGLETTPGYSVDGPLTAQAHALTRHTATTSIGGDLMDRARRVFLQRAAELGIVSVSEAGGPEISGLEDFREVIALPTDGTIDIRGMWGALVDSPEGAHELLAETGAQSLAGDLFIDGSLGSRTALLTVPYRGGAAEGAPDTGVRYIEDEELAQHVHACTLAGVQTGVHAIGDGAVRSAVAAYAAAVEGLGTPRVASCLHRIDHCEMVTAEDAELLARAGIIPCAQPMFDALWGGPDGLYADRLGVDRALAMNPFALLAKSGVTLSFSSDCPVCTLDPWQTVRAATTHHTPESSISPRAAFTACTRGAWKASGVADGLHGVLTPGAPAHFVVWEATELEVSAPNDAVQRWSTDPRSGVAPLPVLAEGSPRALRTVRSGRVIYDAPMSR